MATIVTRAGKGSALTFTEGDANFTNLNTAKIENVVEDLTPQLGGNLDVQSNSITTSVTDGNIQLSPNGNGVVFVATNKILLGNANSAATITTNGTGNLTLDTNGGTNSGTITINQGANSNISISPNGTGSLSCDKVTRLTANVSSTSTTTGTLVVTGGAGFSGGINVPNIGLNTSAYTTASQLSIGQAHTTADANNVTFGRSRGTWGVQSAVQNADELAEFFVTGNDGSATTPAGQKVAYGWNTTMTDAPSTGLLPHITNYFVNTTAGVLATYMSISNDAVFRVREIGVVGGITNLNITAGTDGNIVLAPNGTGRVVLDGQNWPQAAPATNGEYLTSTAAGQTSWTDRVNAKTIYETVKNVSGGSLAKGTPVYQVGITGNTITVGAARSDDVDKLAIGVLDETIADEAEGRMIVLGEIKGVDTSAFSTGDKIYLGATGGYTNTPPTSSTVARQFLGVVFRVHATVGSGYITGTLTEDQVKWTGTAFEFWDGDSWVMLIDDSTTSTSTTWSSDKIDGILGDIAAALAEIEGA